MVLDGVQVHEEFPLADDVLQSFIKKYLVFAICWSFGGDMRLGKSIPVTQFMFHPSLSRESGMHDNELLSQDLSFDIIEQRHGSHSFHKVYVVI